MMGYFTGHIEGEEEILQSKIRCMKRFFWGSTDNFLCRFKITVSLHDFEVAFRFESCYRDRKFVVLS